MDTAGFMGTLLPAPALAEVGGAAAGGAAAQPFVGVGTPVQFLGGGEYREQFNEWIGTVVEEPTINIDGLDIFPFLFQAIRDNNISAEGQTVLFTENPDVDLRFQQLQASPRFHKRVYNNDLSTHQNKIMDRLLQIKSKLSSLNNILLNYNTA